MIDLDTNATTPLDPEIFSAMRPYFLDNYGNAASRGHALGWSAAQALADARKKTTISLEGSGEESVIFTGSATEANNLVIRGAAEAARAPIHIITQATEHKCVIEACRAVERVGHRVTILPVDQHGLIDPQNLQKALTPQTQLVSIMLANNETGVIQDIATLLKITRENSSALFHTDAAQAIGKISVSLKTLPVDFLTLSAHKFYGPKGVGALYIDPKVSRSKLKPLIVGGVHEFGLRAGTVNVPGVVGLTAALEKAVSLQNADSQRLAQLRDHLESALLKEIEFSFVHGDRTKRLPNTTSLRFDGIDADQLMLALGSKLAVSSGAACSTGSTEPSYVLQAMGLSRDQAKSALRLSLGRSVTPAQIDEAIFLIKDAVTKQRAKSLAWQMRVDT